MAVDENEFVYKGFNGANISLEGVAKIHSNGLLQLTNFSKYQIGRAFYKYPIRFDTSSFTLPQALSFSTHFVFAIVPETTNPSFEGMAFAISPSMDLNQAMGNHYSPSMDFNQAVGNQYFGLLNSSKNLLLSNHLLVIELNTQMNPEFYDTNDNHVRIDVNSLVSNVSTTVTYYSNREWINRSLELVSGSPLSVWIEYDGFENVLNVMLAPIRSPKPDQSLLSTHINLSSILLDSMYVGFSAATGILSRNNYILEEELLEAGGFGKVYGGVIPSSKEQVAIKKVSHNSKQGMKEFVAEIASMGRLRHRNLVQLLGYSRRKGELLLVYDYMPNGSLDKVVKASNVLLDSELNGRLGDFGLARLYDHGANLETTKMAGTVGYLAPELCRIGKATTSTDVFSFGAFLLEVACGRRPIHPQQSPDKVVLVDWVFEKWKEGAILETSDPRLGGDYLEEKMELVLKLGLLCSNSDAVTRPSMRQVMQYLDGDVRLREIIRDTRGLDNEASSEFLMPFPSSILMSSAISISSTESKLTCGRYI
ncbi:hypothetical protein RHMOL_Rhmol01G0313700 [Rhododendron molle]|uniref:Uncharacterized protein n=1 Tax=Rhododendron molle TaxID=49168 RepID=A0ACC0Q9I0_RHOML|nr:hypothetical protein RHMOL_Rhmol01G0313700 [Rhododendron molle]